jgi:hypothetical protein
MAAKHNNPEAQSEAERELTNGKEDETVTEVVMS